MKDNEDIPGREPDISSEENDDAPKFGRLLIILGLAVMLIIAITFATEAYYSS